ncbi:MAG: hypothetical protein ABI598_02635 [Chloroflexota bacterium]
MWFRAHGYVFDWGSLRWCQAQATPSDGCFDVENVALDEFGHVDVLGHHVNLAGNSDYRDAIVQAVARAKPAAGWQAHVFGPCDTARLQLEYDRQSPRDLFSSCLAIPTKLVLSASSTSLPTGGGLTMTASLRTTTTTANRALSNDPVSGRNVTLRRRIPGTQTWYSAGLLVSSGSVEGSYALTINPSTTYEWQAVFIPSSGDGAVSATSAVVTVTVSGCASVTCGQAPVMTAAESTWRTRS